MKSKKLRILIILIVIAALIIVAVIVFSGKQKKVSVLEDNLAAGPMAYVYIKKPAEHIQDVLSTKFVQGLHAIDMIQILEDMGVSQQQLSQMQETFRDMDLGSIQKLIRVLFSEEMGLAFYSENFPANPQEASLETVASHLACVTRLKGGMAFLDIMIGVLAKLSPDIEDTKFTYKRHTIHLLSDAEKTFKIGYTKIGSFLIFGYGDQAARMAIDTVSQESVRSLAQDNQVKAIVSQASPESYVKGFIDAGMVLDQMHKQMLGTAAKVQDPKTAVMQANKIMRDQKGFKFLVFTMGAVDKAQKCEARLFYDEKQLSSDVKSYFRAVSPTFSVPLRFTPQRVLVYRWSNGLDMAFMWNRLQLKLLDQVKKGGGQMPASQVLAIINEGMGFDIKEDLFPLIGDEYGGYVVDIQENPFYPIPRAVFFLKVTDRQKASEFLLQQIESFNIIRLEKENYKGTEIFFVRLPILSDVVPAYAFVEGYLLGAINKADLIESIDVLTDDTIKSLASADVMQDVGYGLAQNTNGLIMFQVGKFASELYKVVEWWGGWVEAKERTHKAAISGTQLRLEEITNTIASYDTAIQEAQEKVSVLEGQIAEVDQEALLQDLEKAQSAYDQKRKLLDHARERVDELKTEQQELMVVKETGEKQLSAAGEFRLEEIDEGLEKNMQRAEKLREETQKAESERNVLSLEVDRVEKTKTELDGVKDELAQVEFDRSAGSEKKKDVEQALAELKAEKFISSEKRERLKEKGMKPFLKALSYWKWFAMKKVLRSGEIGFQCFWEVE